MNHEPPFRRYVKPFWQGFAMGGANIVPAVSGGTIALILGIYPRLIRSLGDLTRRDFLSPLIRLRIREAGRAVDLTFLLMLGLGLIAAVVTLSRGLEWLLAHHQALLFSFFFGLVLASVVTMLVKAGRWRSTQYACFASATLGAFLFFNLAPANTPEAAWFMFICGTFAICALILPGVSGAFMLVLLGKYNHLLAAVTSGDLAVLAPVAAGSLFGLLSVVRLLSWLLTHYQHTTHAILSGFVLGSLRKLWPWDLGENDVLVSTSTLPPDLGHLSAALLLMLIGFVMVLVMERFAAKG